MCLSPTIGKQKVATLIYSGLTHNIISKWVVNHLKLLVVPTELFQVKVANNKLMRCQGRFTGVLITFQGILFHLTLSILPLTNLDLVFGVQ